MSSNNNNDNDNKNNNNEDEDDSKGFCGCADDVAREINNLIEKAFCAVGYVVGQFPYIVLGLVLLFLGLCCFGFLFMEFETEIFNLWTPTDAPVFAESEFIDEFWADSDYGLIILTAVSKDGDYTNVLDSEYLRQWYQVHLDIKTQLPHYEYEFRDSNGDKQTIELGYFADDYYEPPSLEEIAYRAANGQGPTHYASRVVPMCRMLSQSILEAQFEMPCYVLTVMDCFSEGGYFFPYENYLQKTYLANFVPANPFIYTRDSFEGKTSVELGEAMAASCATWTGTTAPSNYIYGGEVRVNETDETSTIVSLTSYQILAYLDSATSLARKLKIARGECQYTATYAILCDEVSEDEVTEAEEVLDEWLLDYIDFMEDYTNTLNSDDEKLWRVVFWTPRTARDLLKAASSADFGLLALAYIAMIVFASLTAIRPSDWFLSRSEASFCGVLLVLLAVLATIGLGSFFVTLSPNVIQVLPFIALGFGVDDMFVLLFSFKYRERLSVEDMISETTRIAGSSVALTSLANFLGFIVGTTMVLPDVARFATFGALIVLLNFISIIFGFTAVLSLVARRMKAEYNDWSWIFCFAHFTKATKITSEKPSSMAPSIFDPLFDWLTKNYTRIILIILFITLIIVGIYGCTLISPGLPLANIVPDGTYAYDFLYVRELFYFSYIISIYTDAHGGYLKPMDWENKFESWIDETENIYDVSHTIYQTPAVHDFWAWEMRDYLAEKAAESLSGKYTISDPLDVDALMAGDPIRYQSWMCETDRELYCKFNVVNYQYGTDLFWCLLVNYQWGYITSDDCSNYIVQEYTENLNFDYIAYQLYVTSYANSSIDVSGLYVRPYTNDIKVYTKQANGDDDSGYIYQEDCGEDECNWYILDSMFNPLYKGDATSITSNSPSMGGWREFNTGESVEITHLYYDFLLNYIGIERDTTNAFILNDVAPPTDFLFSQEYPDDDDASCNQWEVFRLLMSDTTAFNELSFSNAFNTSSLDMNDNEVICNAITESSEMCGAIRDSSYLGSVTCGKYELFSNQNLWFIGELDDEAGFNVISNNQDVNGRTTEFISNRTAEYGCEDPTDIDSYYLNYTYNYLRPCSEDFGGFGIDATDNSTNAPMCDSDDQIINVECNSLSDCNDLRVCFNDYYVLNKVYGYAADCDMGGDITLFDIKYRNDPSNTLRLAEQFDKCLIPHYSLLSDCCKTAAKSLILDNDKFDCDYINNVVGSSAYGGMDDLEEACYQKEKCSYSSGSCDNVCTGSVWNDCNDIIIDNQCTSAISQADLLEGNQTLFLNCITSALSTSSVSYPCCQAAIVSISGMEDCVHPLASYWDFGSNEYDYSICSDLEISSIINQTCGTMNDANDTQRDCLVEKMDQLPSGCCKQAIEQQSTNTYSFTVECEADAQRICGISAGYALILASQGYTDCSSAVVSQLLAGGLTPKCTWALGTCETDGEWEFSPYGKTTTLPCDIGYNGNKTRECFVETNDVGLPQGPAYWLDVDTSQCSLQTCGAITDRNSTDSYGQIWPETLVGNIVTVQGGAVNQMIAGLPSFLVDSLDVPPEYFDYLNTVQVSAELQDLFEEKYNYTCFNGDGNVWYATRLCGLSEYTSLPEWKEPTVECRGFYTFWDEGLREETVCDILTEQVTANLADAFDSFDAATQFYYGYDPHLGDGNSITTIKKSNLIDIIPWSVYADTYNNGVMPSHDVQISLSQQNCELGLDNCQAFTHDTYNNISYFFDYCNTLTKLELNTEPINAVIDSPGYPDSFDALAALFAPGYPGAIYASWQTFGLNTFADMSNTYFKPLDVAEFTAQVCSMRSVYELAKNTTKLFANTTKAFNELVLPYDAWTAEGIPDPYCFNNTLWLFFIDPTGGVVFKDKVVFQDPNAIYSTENFDAVQIKTTSNTIAVRYLDDDEVAVDLIVDLRHRLDDWADKGLYAIPGGLVLDLFSQYIGVSDYLVLNLVYVSIAIIGCCLIFLLNPIAVVVALICNLAMIVEVYGFADWFGLRVNGVLVLNIVIAVALTMEFTAHIGRAFVLTSVSARDRIGSIALPFSNDGQIRMKKTLREMFTPVSLGALTTLIGIAPISAAQFPYFRQYYFTLYIMIIFFGWLNGVIFQVVILSFIPPAPFHLNKEDQYNPNQSQSHSLKQHVELQQVSNKDNDYKQLKDDNDAGDGGNTGDYNTVPDDTDEDDYKKKKNLPTRSIDDAP